MVRVHATCVDLSGFGLLLRGPPGAGKSDLALRLIDGGGALVADDQVEIELEDGRLIARAPKILLGLLEVRGIGILSISALPSTEIRLVVDLVEADAVERLPDHEQTVILGSTVRRVAIAPFETSAAAKLRLTAAALGGAAGSGRIAVPS